VEGIGGDQGALQRRLGQFSEQGFDGRNFIALFLDGLLSVDFCRLQAID
jgi:hypothetical protein